VLKFWVYKSIFQTASFFYTILTDHYPILYTEKALVPYFVLLLTYFALAGMKQAKAEVRSQCRGLRPTALEGVPGAQPGGKVY